MGNSGNKVDTGSSMGDSSAGLMPQAYEKVKGSVDPKESESKDGICCCHCCDPSVRQYQNLVSPQ